MLRLSMENLARTRSGIPMELVWEWARPFLGIPFGKSSSWMAPLPALAKAVVFRGAGRRRRRPRWEFTRVCFLKAQILLKLWCLGGVGRTGNVLGYFWLGRNSSGVIPIPLSECLESQKSFGLFHSWHLEEAEGGKGGHPAPDIPSNPTIPNPAQDPQSLQRFGEIWGDSIILEFN